MLADIFTGIFDATSESSSVDVKNFLICLAVSLAIGAFLAAVYTFKNRYTKSFILTLGLLPAVVAVVIMLVNGNIGAGIAVAGAFGLVRFRSAQGTAREIGAIFLAMGAGLACGMGYLGYAGLFVLILGAAMFVFQWVTAKRPAKKKAEKLLTVTIPEDLDYGKVFDDLFDKYTDGHESVQVKTVNMGSMYRLKYLVKLKDTDLEKAFIDEIRCRNGNLEVSLNRVEEDAREL